MTEILALPIETISISGGTQSRAALNQETVAEYAEAIRLAVELPPVVVFNDGASGGLWLADGFHRFHAHRAAGAMEITCDVRVGTQRDAVLYSVGANASHGLRRTNEDKRRAVMTLLNDAEWAAWSGNQIAKACAVSESFVRHLRLNEDTPAPAVRTVERNGKIYEQNTANIGKAKPPEAPSPAAPCPGVTLPPASVEEVAVAVSVEPFDELADLRDRYEEMAESFKSTMDENLSMARVFDADDRITAAMAEVARYKAIAENAERTLLAKSGEFIERARAVTYWKNRAEKAEKALKKLEAQP